MLYTPRSETAGRDPTVSPLAHRSGRHEQRGQPDVEAAGQPGARDTQRLPRAAGGAAQHAHGALREPRPRGISSRGAAGAAAEAGPVVSSSAATSALAAHPPFAAAAGPLPRGAQPVLTGSGLIIVVAAGLARCLAPAAARRARGRAARGRLAQQRRRLCGRSGRARAARRRAARPRAAPSRPRQARLSRLVGPAPLSDLRARATSCSRPLAQPAAPRRPERASSSVRTRPRRRASHAQTRILRNMGSMASSFLSPRLSPKGGGGGGGGASRSSEPPSPSAGPPPPRSPGGAARPDEPGRPRAAAEAACLSAALGEVEAELGTERARWLQAADALRADRVAGRRALNELALTLAAAHGRALCALEESEAAEPG